MTYLLIILSAFTISFLVVKFIKWSIAIYLILCAAFFIGIITAFFNLELGIDIAVWSAFLTAAFFFIFMASGFISLLISGLVLGPIGLILAAIGITRLEIKKTSG